MIFLIGFPHSIYADIVKDLVKSINNEYISGLPLSSRDELNDNYARDCLDSILAFHSGRTDCFEKGLAVLIFRPDNESGFAFPEFLYPFSIVREIPFGRRIAHSGKKMLQDKNEVSRRTIAAGKSALKVRNQVASYLASRCNRTPFLLPRRHFNENALETMIKEAWEKIQHSNDVIPVLEQIAENFEKHYPFVKGKRVSGFFVNSKYVEFRSPGRDLHGLAHPRIEGHEDQCFLNGSLRIGGPIRKGFHYDCTHKGGKHGGTFHNCHNERVTTYGNPHLNVFPNDFIR